MSQERRSFLADFTDPDKVEFMAHMTPKQHRAWVHLMTVAENKGFERMKSELMRWIRTTRSVLHTKNVRVGSEQEVEVLRQHVEAVERVDDPPDEFSSKGLFPVKKKRPREVMNDGQGT
jgi:hypothetical protein